MGHMYIGGYCSLDMQLLTDSLDDGHGHCELSNTYLAVLEISNFKCILNLPNFFPCSSNYFDQPPDLLHLFKWDKLTSEELISVWLINPMMIIKQFRHLQSETRVTQPTQSSKVKTIISQRFLQGGI